jgi:cytochrome b subunit of formate dehydrogenase
VRGVIHRVAGVVMMLTGFYHLVSIFFTKHGKQFRQDMIPRWKDVAGAFKNLLYIAGLSRKKPRFDRFGYVEKIEYWALFWSILIMSITGVILWFETFSIALFTKLGWDIAQTIHLYEACLATLAIVVWHCYFVIFNPNIYPMSTAWLTGKISEEEMAREHPLELERIKK